MSYKQSRIVVVIPVYNEQNSIAKVVRELNDLRYQQGPLIDEIIVCDNNSSDRTFANAQNAGATVVCESIQGYGAACLRGIKELQQRPRQTADIVVFVDGDYSAYANEVITLLDAISGGADLVVGSRNNENREKGALSVHQRFGNRLACGLIRLIWNRAVNDLGPFRAIRYSRLLELDMQDQRFGWTVEMQVKTLQADFKYAEVPVSTRPRIGVSKISGTVTGTVGAAMGIFGKIFELYFHERKFVESINRGDFIKQ